MVSCELEASSQLQYTANGYIICLYQHWFAQIVRARQLMIA